MKPFFTLTFVFFIQLQGRGQGTNFYTPVQDDSIYKKAGVKSRESEYSGQGPGGGSKEVMYFNKQGKKLQSDTYTVFNPESANYRAISFYKNNGQLDSSISRDLANKRGLRITMFAEGMNVIIRKFEYDSSNKLRRKFSCDSLGIVCAESFFYEKAVVTRHYDMRKKLRLELIDSVEKDNWYNKSLMVYFSDSGTISAKNETRYIYKYDEMGRVIKAYQQTEEKYLIFEYIYNKKGLLKKVIMSGLYDAQIKFKYDFWDSPANINLLY